MQWKIDQQQFGVFVTNRKNGVSQYPYLSNNLALHVGDDPNHVNDNRNQLALSQGFNQSDLVFMHQVHGTIVEKIDLDSNPILTCDAMVTNIKNKVLMVMVADCVPILFADVKRRVVAVAHAGWKGTVGEIAKEVVEKMIADYGSALDDIIAWQGPCIQSCCYSVGQEVMDACRLENSQRSFSLHDDNLTYFDMHQYNQQLLISIGIPEQNITNDKTCVSCCSSDYFSHRSDNGKTGRFAAGIWIK